MNKRIVLFIILGAVVGGVFGAAGGNGSSAIIISSLAGAFLGWFAGAGPTKKQQ